MAAWLAGRSNQAKYQRTFNAYLGRRKNYVSFEYLLHNCALARRAQSKKIIVIIGGRRKTEWRALRELPTTLTTRVEGGRICARSKAALTEQSEMAVRIDADGDNDDGIYFSYLLAKSTHNSLSPRVVVVVAVIALIAFCAFSVHFSLFAYASFEKFCLRICCASQSGKLVAGSKVHTCLLGIAITCISID